MAIDSPAPVISIIGVIVGLALLLTGVGVHGTEPLQPIGGGIVLISLGILTVFIARLEPVPE